MTDYLIAAVLFVAMVTTMSTCGSASTPSAS